MAFDLRGDVAHVGRRIACSVLSSGSVYVGTESVYYAASGLAEAGSAVLFLHEEGGSGATWGGQLSGLLNEGRCLAPDLPGHGQSTGLGCASVAEYRSAMIGFLEALAIRWPVVVAGVSLGAAIAIDLAIHAPERVAGLILAGLSDGERITAELCQQAARGEAPSDFIDGMFSENVAPSLKRVHLKRWNTTLPTVRFHDLVALRQYPVRESLSRVRHRVLVVAGEQDRLILPETVQRLAGAGPRGEMALIPAAGTLSMVEQPERFNRLVGGFLEDVRPDVPAVPERAYVGGYRRSRIR